jgi:hypothetical protein
VVVIELRRSIGNTRWPRRSQHERCAGAVLTLLGQLIGRGKAPAREIRRLPQPSTAWLEPERRRDIAAP